MNILILGGARDFHAMDWYRNIKNINSHDSVFFLTDTITSEGLAYKYNSDDKIDNLFIVDKYLLKKNNKYTDLWRNIFKLLVLPIQVFLLLKYCKVNKINIIHAHPMYYMFLCFLANLRYIGTPQGSEILIRPHKNNIYKYFASIILSNAQIVTVDSFHMKSNISKFSKSNVKIIQNGIDTMFFMKSAKNTKNIPICSIRGLTCLYRIEQIFLSRNNYIRDIPITTVSPFQKDEYYDYIRSISIDSDIFRTHLIKSDFANLLGQTLLAVSIPSSDSSPRSVYEAIFAGAFVATTYLPWVDNLPSSMLKRLILCNLRDPHWLESAYFTALKNSNTSFQPCADSINKFDQLISMKRFYLNYHELM